MDVWLGSLRGQHNKGKLGSGLQVRPRVDFYVHGLENA